VFTLSPAGAKSGSVQNCGRELKACVVSDVESPIRRYLVSCSIARSRSTSAMTPDISVGLVSCSRNQPISFQPSRLIQAPYEDDLWPLEYFLYEMIAVVLSLLIFQKAEMRGIDGVAQFVLKGAQNLGQSHA
jgi:hypothetical protein